MLPLHGLANQLAPFDSDLAKKLALLRHLLKRQESGTFELNDDERRAFAETNQQTLAFYRPGQNVQINTDAACTKGFGFVLTKLQVTASGVPSWWAVGPSRRPKRDMPPWRVK